MDIIKFMSFVSIVPLNATTKKASVYRYTKAIYLRE